MADNRQLLAQPICINITGHHVLITSCIATDQNRLGIAPYCHECSEAAHDYVWPCENLSMGELQEVAKFIGGFKNQVMLMEAEAVIDAS